MPYKKPTKAVITDAGFASRFLPITKTIPKAMIPLGAKPIMQYVVEECVAGGITDIIIVATHEGRPIYEDYFSNPCEKIYAQLESQGKLDRFESVRQVLSLANITVIEQDPALPYGNGSPIASAKPYLADDEAFIALYSDDLIFGEGDVKTLIDAFEKASGKELPHYYTDRRAGDLAEMWASPAKAEAELGWKATLTVEDAVKDTINYLNHEAQQ